MGPVLVFDIGGTHVRGALWDPASGGLARTARRPTRNFIDRPELDAAALFRATMAQVRAVGLALARGAVPEAVVLGWPGPVAPDGTALRSPTILGPDRDGPLPVKAALGRIWPGSRIAVLNDLTAAGYAYASAGGRDFCIVTVGSGIGNKLFVDGRPVVGPGGRGGEIGHLAARLAADCPPGLVEPGIRLGEIASGRGTLRLARRLAALRPDAFAASSLAAHGPGFENAALAAAFRAGDGFARAAVTLAAAPLAHALAGAHGLAGTERFVITGGFATALGEPYRRILVAAAREATWDLGQDWDAMIEEGDERDGLIGAGLYAQLELGAVRTAA